MTAAAAPDSRPPAFPGAGGGGGTPTQVISRYLSQLAVAASGLDSAIVNDILADAEQHLWNAVSDGVPAEQAVVAFGDPRDVVAGYVSSETVRRGGVATQVIASHGGVAGNSGGRWGGSGGAEAVTPIATIAGGQVVSPMPAQKNVFARIPIIGVWADRYAWGALALFLVGFALATAYFAIVMTWGSLALGTIILIIGFPLLVGLLGFCRVVVLGHGWLIQLLTGVRMPRRTAPVAGVGMASFWGRIKLWLKDGRSWLSVAYLLGNYPVAIALFAVFTSLAGTSLALVFGPIGEVFMPDEWFAAGNGFHFGPWWHGGRMPPALGFLSVMFGIALFTGTLWLAKGSGWLYAQVAKAIQVTRPVPVGPVQV